MYANSVIMLTGGTGSFGQAFTAYLLKCQPMEIRIFSRGELLQVLMSQRFDNPRLRFFIGDVRDKERLCQAMRGVDIVVHAAALKQVPIGETNPTEVIKTNCTGAMNVIEAAWECGVEKVLAISSDKAVEPVNLYGATKMVMEKLMVQANELPGHKTKFSCVRYGNVVGSRGSVIPLWREQSKTGRITITDPAMTRFWITLPLAVKFVTDCIGVMQGGEIFVPRIPSMNVTDLAEAIAPGCQREITGIRPGEKLHETLISEVEVGRTVRLADAFVIHTEDEINQYLPTRMGVHALTKPYISNTNDQWLTVGDMRGML